MPVGPARMPLLDHLSELRRRLTIIVMCVLVTTLVIYMASPGAHPDPHRPDPPVHA